MCIRDSYKIKGPEHIALITDSIRAGAADVPEGTVVYDDKEGRRPICIKGGVAVMPDGKNFAGSIATTPRLVRTMVQMCIRDRRHSDCGCNLRAV